MAVLVQGQFVFKLDNGIGGSPTDYSSQITEIDVPFKINAGEHWTFGSRDSQRTVGGRSHEIALTVRVQDTATSLFGILMAVAESVVQANFNGTLTFQLGVPDFTTTGSHTLTGESKIIDGGTPWSGKAGKGDVQTAKFKLGADGAVTYAVA